MPLLIGTIQKYDDMIKRLNTALQFAATDSDAPDSQ